jgi:hypothetical protein
MMHKAELMKDLTRQDRANNSFKNDDQDEIQSNSISDEAYNLEFLI